jgi:hypothetical protein
MILLNIFFGYNNNYSVSNSSKYNSNNKIIIGVSDIFKIVKLVMDRQYQPVIVFR